MEPQAVKELIEAGLPGCEARVSGDGSHFDAIVIGEVFAGKSPVKRQQLVYSALGDHISSGAIHAISMKTYTPAEWAALGR